MWQLFKIQQTTLSDKETQSTQANNTHPRDPQAGQALHEIASQFNFFLCPLLSLPNKCWSLTKHFEMQAASASEYNQIFPREHNM